MTTGQGNDLMPTKPGRGMEGAREDLSPQSADCLHSEPGTALNRNIFGSVLQRAIVFLSSFNGNLNTVLEDR